MKTTLRPFGVFLKKQSDALEQGHYIHLNTQELYKSLKEQAL
jgi:hypothetical protein